MDNFARSILNYFATFNETRFLFSKKVAYSWTSDIFTFDLSVFPQFESALLDAISTNRPLSITVREGDHAVVLDSLAFKSEFQSALRGPYGSEYLEDCLNKARESLKVTQAPTLVPVNEHGQALSPVMNADFENQVFKEGVRQYCIALRREVGRLMTKLQEEKQQELATQYGLKEFPASTFNSRREEQKVFDDLIKLGAAINSPESFIEAVQKYIATQDFRFVMYDLYFAMRRFHQQIPAPSLHLFFHEIGRAEDRFPLFSCEVDIKEIGSALELRTTRDHVMLNTPAINFFQFSSVLTTPRATNINTLHEALSVIEQFLQNAYKVSDAFILKQHYSPLSSGDLPTVRYRIGLQVIKDEDRKILDYSELITDLDSAAAKKFTELISSYVEGNVRNTADDVQNVFDERYPRHSVNHLLQPGLDVPLHLNRSQKKILTAIENPNNRIIVVDGPPGTGKSYAITAILYLANQRGRSAVVTSHKEQALDVIDDFLTEQFKTLHPRAKPNILRLAKGGSVKSINRLENTLANPAINGAASRLDAFNPAAVQSDRAQLADDVTRRFEQFWDASEQYDPAIRLACEMAELESTIFGAREELSEPTPRFEGAGDFAADKFVSCLQRVVQLSAQFSLDALLQLYKRRHELPEILDLCEQLNRLPISELAAIDLPTVPAEPLLGKAEADIDELLRACTPDAVVRDLDFKNTLAISAPRCPIDEISGFESFRSLVGTLQRMKSERSKLIGRFKKTGEYKQIEQYLVRSFPKFADHLDKVGVTETLGDCEAHLSRVAEAARSFPFLRPDYLFGGCQKPATSALLRTQEQLSTLELAPVKSAAERLMGKPFQEMSLKSLKASLEKLKQLKIYRELIGRVKKFADILGLAPTDVSRVHQDIKAATQWIEAFELDELELLQKILKHYSVVLDTLKVNPADLSSVPRLIQNDDAAKRVLKYIELHARLSAQPALSPPSRTELKGYYDRNQKLLLHRTDNRFKDLRNYTADIQRILTSINTGKRLSREQADVLLKHLSCIIAEPQLISQYFPMDADMFDLLIIDEASQVSIAESISLMLRAKQTVVFGDELQYGAVGAVNVSTKYAGHYFREILDSYASDRHETLVAEERERIANEAVIEPDEEEAEASRCLPVEAGTKEWLKTFGVRTSTLAFARALGNYADSLNVHFRSFPEIISYSNEVFYKESQIELITNRIRTKPIGQVLRFIKVDTKGFSGPNVNLDEIEAIKTDLQKLLDAGYKGTIGIICSFREQTRRMEEVLRNELPAYPDLVRHQKFKVWFVGDVQGEERDLIYYSFVQDKKLNNADLRTIYPIIGGTADNIRRLKMQRLNVGFSRARDTMVFVHSMPLEDYSDTRLGDALRFYRGVLDSARDHYIEDESIFGSPQEKKLYSLLTQTDFFQKHKADLRLTAQFEIGKYIREEFHKYIPNYRVDFLLTLSKNGKDQSLIIEYDGVEFHTKDPTIVNAVNVDREYLEYDINRQLELESYGYGFLRIHKYSLMPTATLKTPVAVLSKKLEESFNIVLD
jgi:hypothetical protein